MAKSKKRNPGWQELAKDAYLDEEICEVMRILRLEYEGRPKEGDSAMLRQLLTTFNEKMGALLMELDRAGY